MFLLHMFPKILSFKIALFDVIGLTILAGILVSEWFSESSVRFWKPWRLFEFSTRAFSMP